MPLDEARREKERVLSLASKLFARVGFEAATLEDLARFAKVERAAMTRLCFSKEDLFFQVLTREVSMLVQQAEDAFEDSSPAPDALIRRLTHDALDLAMERPLVRALMVGRFDDRLAQWKDRLHELRMRCVAVPEKVLRVGISSGFVRQDLPVELTGQLLLELHVMGYASLTGADAKERAAARRRVALELILRGLKHPSVEARPLVAVPSAAPPPPSTASGEHWAPDLSAPARERLLDAAARVAKTQGGLSAVTPEASARLAAVKVPDELSSREALLFALLERDAGAVVAEVEAAAQDRQGPAIELFRAMSERSFQALQARPLVLTLVTGAAQEALPGFEEQLSALVRRMAAVLVPVLQLGASQRLFREDLDPELVALVLLELHFAGHLLAYRPGPDLRLRALQRRVAALDLIFRGIAAH